MIWLPRLKKIAFWWTSIVIAFFIAQAIVFTVRANSGDFAQEVAAYQAAQTECIAAPGCPAAAGCPADAPCAGCPNAIFE